MTSTLLLVPWGLKPTLAISLCTEIMHHTNVATDPHGITWNYNGFSIGQDEADDFFIGIHGRGKLWPITFSEPIVGMLGDGHIRTLHAWLQLVVSSNYSVCLFYRWTDGRTEGGGADGLTDGRMPDKTGWHKHSRAESS